MPRMLPPSYVWHFHQKISQLHSLKLKHHFGADTLDGTLLTQSSPEAVAVSAAQVISFNKECKRAFQNGNWKLHDRPDGMVSEEDNWHPGMLLWKFHSVSEVNRCSVALGQRVVATLAKDMTKDEPGEVLQDHTKDEPGEVLQDHTKHQPWEVLQDPPSPPDFLKSEEELLAASAAQQPMEQEEEEQPRETKHQKLDEQVAQQPSETTSGPSDAMAKLEPLDTDEEMERKRLFRLRLGEAISRWK